MAKKNPKDNLVPFKPGQSGNPKGRPKGPISSILKELGDLSEIEYDITMTNTSGETKTAKAKIKSNEKGGSINSVIAVRLLNMALNGNLSAIKEVLDRTEGKARMSIEHSGEISQKAMPSVVIEGRPHESKRAAKGDSK